MLSKEDKIALASLSWFMEDRTVKDIRRELATTLAYIRQLTEQVRKKKNRKGFSGKLSAKDLLVKGNKALSHKISIPEYRLGKSLEALLTPHNFAFFADKVKVMPPKEAGDQEEFWKSEEVASNSHALVLEVDSLVPLWKVARKKIYELVHDYVGMMGLTIELPQGQKQLAQAMRELASEIVKLYEGADPNAADIISKQAHRKLLEYTVTRSTGEQADLGDLGHVVHPAEVQAAHAYRVLLAERDAKKLSQSEFVRGVAALVSKLPPEVKKHWQKWEAKQNNYHIGYAKYLSQAVAPLIAVLDKGFDARSIIRVIGHNFEPDYLLKDLSGNTVWGEYLGMAVEASSGGTHYNIRSEFKKMGYGRHGVFFYPNHLGKFPNPELMAVLQQANVVGFDNTNNQYFVMVNGAKDFISVKSPKAE